MSGIKAVDIPVRQVLVEARVVVADDRFSRDLGARLDFKAGANSNGTNLGTAANITDSGAIANGGRAVPGGSPNVNLPVANPFGSLAFTFLNVAGNLLDFELSAMKADQRGKVVSSPRIITADKQKATIESGTEIPYQQASSSGATTVAFKPAVLSLAVTPQITPDGRIIMDVEIKKDQIGTIFSGVPSVDTRKITTQILLNDGFTAVIGGIYETTVRNDVNKMPFMGDLPFIGNAFKKHNQAE